MKQKNLFSVFSAKDGQALIIILVVMAIASIILAASVFASIGQAKSSVRTQIGREVYYATEAGLEDAVVRMLRKNPTDPNTCSLSTTENITVGSVDVVISYLPFLGGCVIFSTAQSDGITKKIQVFANLSTYNTTRVFDISSWSEVLP